MTVRVVKRGLLQMPNDFAATVCATGLGEAARYALLKKAVSWTGYASAALVENGLGTDAS